jgi:hypothetical protein
MFDDEQDEIPSKRPGNQSLRMKLPVKIEKNLLLL